MFVKRNAACRGVRNATVRMNCDCAARVQISQDNAQFILRWNRHHHKAPRNSRTAFVGDFSPLGIRVVLTYLSSFVPPEIEPHRSLLSTFALRVASLVSLLVVAHWVSSADVRVCQVPPRAPSRVCVHELLTFLDLLLQNRNLVALINHFTHYMRRGFICQPMFHN